MKRFKYMITCIVRVYNDVFHIYNCLVGIYGILDELIIVEGNFFPSEGPLISGGYSSHHSQDGTLDEIDRFIETFDKVNKKVSVVSRKFVDGQNHSTPLYEGSLVSKADTDDHLLIVDSDEIYTSGGAKSIKDYITSNPFLYRLGVTAYNLVGVDYYRSDSFDFPMCIGGRIGKKGSFYGDRNTVYEENVHIIPNVHCFHYSLLKPVSNLKFKLNQYPNVKDHWVLKDNKPTFIDGTTIIKYDGELPGGYSRELGVTYEGKSLFYGGDLE